MERSWRYNNYLSRMREADEELDQIKKFGQIEDSEDDEEMEEDAEEEEETEFPAEPSNEPSADYLDELKKLINGEMVASIQYRIAAESIVGSGENFGYIQSHCEEHADEELDHYSELVSALMQRDGEACMDLTLTIKDALPETEELTSFDCGYLRDFFERAEDNAIKAYQEFYDRIEDEDKDLADIINGIISDEREHKLDFGRIDK